LAISPSVLLVKPANDELESTESATFCKACFAGEYPVAVPKPAETPQMGLFEEECLIS
jgi:hypothetical protein